MVNLPLQGTPGTRDARNPTLLPNFDKSVASGNGTVDHQSPAAFYAANPRTPATATATFGGTPTTGDEITLVIANPILAGEAYSYLPGSEVGVTYTVLSSDTVATIAEAFSKLINGNATLAALGVSAQAGGTSGAVLTVSHQGPIGNFSVLSSPQVEGTTITVGGTALTGDQLCVLFSGPAYGAGILITVPTTTSQSTTTMATNLKNAINANATLAADGITATSSAAVVSVTVPAAEEPVTLSAFVNTIAPTVTIGGTVSAGDVLNLTFTNAAGLTGSPITISYTVLLGDTVTSMAAGLTTAINANANLVAAGMVATSAAGVITITYPQINGQFRITESVTGSGTETITVPATPTETLAIASSGGDTVTISPSGGALSGGAGPILAADNFVWNVRGTTSSFWYGQPYSLSYDIVQIMVNGGAPIL